jgi:hypothetical protein
VWLLRAAVAGAILAPFWYWDGGLIETEATVFVRQYHDAGGVLRLVFDPYRNDLGTYQARELSYFFDWLDAQVFGALVSRGYRIFVPLSGVVASILTVFLFLRGARGYGHVPAVTALLLLLAYLTNYAHLVTLGMLYRSAKPLLPPLVVGGTFYLLSRRRRASGVDARGERWSSWLVFVLFGVMSWLDRQGFFLTLVGCGALLIHALVGAAAEGRRWNGRWDFVIAAAGAIAVMTVYNFVALPALVAHLHGYRPSLDYQRLPWTSLADPLVWRHAITLVLQGGALLAGGVPVRVFAGLLGLLVVTAGLIGWRPRKQDLPWMAVAFSQVVLFAMMIARHPPVFDYEDHRVWYYPMALQALCLTGAVVFLQLLLSKGSPARVWIVNLLLAVAVVGNVASWDDYFRLQLRSRWFPVMYEQNLALKASFADGQPRWYLDSAHQLFYRFCRSLERATP